MIRRSTLRSASTLLGSLDSQTGPMLPQHRHNITTACTTCRKRKRRCDGVQPTCSGCQAKHLECVWSGGADRRTQLVAQATQPVQNVTDIMRVLSGMLRTSRLIGWWVRLICSASCSAHTGSIRRNPQLGPLLNQHQNRTSKHPYTLQPMISDSILLQEG